MSVLPLVPWISTAHGGVMDIFLGIVAVLLMVVPVVVLAMQRPAPGENWFPAGASWPAGEPEPQWSRQDIGLRIR